MLFDKIQETTAYIQSIIGNQTPIAGIVLGSGLGNLANDLDVQFEIPYEIIPNFPKSTVQGHLGKLLFGTLGNQFVVMMAGRFHYYEGYDMQEVTFPIRVMKALGIATLFLSNAAGGMNPDFKVGDIMILTDHINQFPEHPLRGPNDERLGTRFPDMSEPYNLNLIKFAFDIAKKESISLKKGVYVGLQGPTYETSAEYKWLHTIGGDAVGMSTVPETIVAIHAGIQVFAASIITDLGIADHVEKVSHEAVLAAANIAAPKLATLIKELINKL